jgi:hypothetical protein
MHIHKKVYEKIILTVLSGSFFITIFRTIRFPNDWAEAHWLVSYEHGFIKRGLPGTIISSLIYSGLFDNELLIKTISTFLLVLFYILLFLLSIRMLKKSDYNFTYQLVLLMFLTSPFITLTAHFNGYYDNILVMFSILGSIMIISGKTGWAVLIMAVGVFVHESFFVFGIPFIIFTAVLMYGFNSKTPANLRLLKNFYLSYPAVILIPLLIFLFITAYQNIMMDHNSMRNELINHLFDYSFIGDDKGIVIPDILTTSYTGFLKEQSPLFFERITRYQSLIRFGLPLILLLIVIWKLFSSKKDRLNWFVLSAVIIIFPLSLHLIAWDTARIWTYPIITGWLFILLITETTPTINSKGKYSGIINIFLIIVILQQVYINTPLMDGESERLSLLYRIIFYAPLYLIFFAINRQNIKIPKKFIHGFSNNN